MDLLIQVLADWLADSRIDWLIDWMADGPIHLLIDWLSVGVLDSLADSRIDFSGALSENIIMVSKVSHTAWLTGWFTNWLTDWIAIHQKYEMLLSVADCFTYFLSKGRSWDIES